MEVKMPDEGGDCITCLQHNGRLFPNFNVQSVKGLNSVKIRDDDILLVAYPKSGNHMLWEIARKILTGTVDFDELYMRDCFMDYTVEDVYADLPSPRLLTTHSLLPMLSPGVLQKKPKLINLIRNPKDVAVSLYNFALKLPYMNYNGKWENFLKPCAKGTFFYGSWCDHVMFWEKLKDDYPDWPILYLYYEDIVERPVPELRKLCKFLDVDRSDEFLRDVNEVCRIDTMKQHRCKTDLDAAVYRKGKVGDWKNWFTVAQNEWFDQYLQEQMVDSKLAAAIRYTPAEDF